MKYLILAITTLILLNINHMDTYAQKNQIEFGIFETVPLNDLRPFSENLAKFILKQSLSLDAPVMGRLSFNDKKIIDSLFYNQEIKENQIMITREKINGDTNSYTLIALKKEAAITIIDLKKTIPSENAIELRFNNPGAKKWAEITRQNVGKMVAFVINDEIWSLPLVNFEIKTGAALISGIENEQIAKEISKKLNKAIKKTK